MKRYHQEDRPAVGVHKTISTLLTMFVAAGAENSELKGLKGLLVDAICHGVRSELDLYPLQHCRKSRHWLTLILAASALDCPGHTFLQLE